MQLFNKSQIFAAVPAF